jgi:hypothetical protein
MIQVIIGIGSLKEKIIASMSPGLIVTEDKIEYEIPLMIINGNREQICRETSKIINSFFDLMEAENAQS